MTAAARRRPTRTGAARRSGQLKATRRQNGGQLPLRQTNTSMERPPLIRASPANVPRCARPLTFTWRRRLCPTTRADTRNLQPHRRSARTKCQRFNEAGRLTEEPTTVGTRLRSGGSSAGSLSRSHSTRRSRDQPQVHGAPGGSTLKLRHFGLLFFYPVYNFPAKK